MSRPIVGFCDACSSSSALHIFASNFTQQDDPLRRCAQGTQSKLVAARGQQWVFGERDEQEDEEEEEEDFDIIICV